MAYQVNSDTVNDGIVTRSSGVLNYNAAYTVTFSLYVPSNTPLYAWFWAICGSSGAGSPIQIGTTKDGLRLKSNGNVLFELWDGADGGQVDTGITLNSGWHYFAVIRSAINSVKVRARLNGASSSSDIATASSDMTGREAAAHELLFGRGSTDNMVPGTRMTNYKAWTAALSNSEVDAEWYTTSFIVTANKWSGSPMGDAATLAGNATADGSGTNWTARADMTYGANNPAISYGSSFIPRAMMLGVG